MRIVDEGAPLRQRYARRARWCLMLAGTVAVVTTGVANVEQTATRVDSKRPRVDAVFAPWSAPTSPGCAVAVIANGRVVLSRAYGSADLDHAVPITPDTVFNIASTSKQFTATAVLLLAQRGRLTLDDDVRLHLPEMPRYERPITVRHLLQHTSGIRDFIDLITLGGGQIDSVMSDAELLSLVARQRGVNFLAGDEYLYSNSGYVLLGMLVERLAGRPFGRFVEGEIFAPLGMANTRVYDDRFAIVKRRAVGYFERPDGTLGQRNSAWDRPADGGVLTTVGDLARWDANFYHARVGGAALMAQLDRPGALHDGRPLEYGLGLRVDTYRGLRRVSHAGGIRGFSAQMVRFPEKRVSTICLCNSSSINATEQAMRVADIFLFGASSHATGAAGAAPPVALSPQDVRSLAGAYRNAETRQVWTLEAQSGALVLRRGGQRSPLDAYGQGRFRIRDDAGGPTLQIDGNQIAASQGDAPPTIYRRVALASPTPDDLTAYAGTYRSDELDRSLAIVVREGALWLDRSGSRVRLTPSVTDEFTGAGLTGVFHHESGRVVGVTLGTNRVRGIRFTLQAPAVTTTPTYDLILAGGRIVDGSGSPWFRADVGIAGDRIAAIGDLSSTLGGRRIDVSGLIVAPGFIDAHAHSLTGLEKLPTADNSVLQGITTAVDGNDGGSPLPIATALDAVAVKPVSLNVALFVGHGTVRREVMGTADRAATAEELSAMKALVATSMEQGALGLSTGLAYVPGVYAQTEEIIELAKVARQHGGLYVSHMRDEGRGTLDSIRETIRIGEIAEVPVHISHIKVAGRAQFGQSTQILEAVDAARARGIDLTFDQYPYTASSTGLSFLFPPWAMAEGKLLERLADPAQRASIKKGVLQILAEYMGNDPAVVQLSNCRFDPSLAGRTIADLLRQAGRPLNADAAADSIIDLQTRGSCSAIYHWISEDDGERLMRSPAGMIASDGGVQEPHVGSPHPRSFGTFPRVLARHVREKRILTLEDAIRRMTSYPAQRLNLPGRGLLRPGLNADIVVFDAATIADRSTFANPHQMAEGVKHLLVNGVPVVIDGRHTGATPGRALTGPGRRTPATQ